MNGGRLAEQQQWGFDKNSLREQLRRELRGLAKVKVMQWYNQLRYRVVRNGQWPVLKDKDKVILHLAEMKVLS